MYSHDQCAALRHVATISTEIIKLRMYHMVLDIRLFQHLSFLVIIILCRVFHKHEPPAGSNNVIEK